MTSLTEEVNWAPNMQRFKIAIKGVCHLLVRVVVLDLCYGNSQKLLILRERLRETEEYKNRERYKDKETDDY